MKFPQLTEDQIKTFADAEQAIADKHKLSAQDVRKAMTISDGLCRIFPLIANPVMSDTLDPVIRGIVVQAAFEMATQFITLGNTVIAQTKLEDQSHDR